MMRRLIIQLRGNRGDTAIAKRLLFRLCALCGQSCPTSSFTTRPPGSVPAGPCKIHKAPCRHQRKQQRSSSFRQTHTNRRDLPRERPLNQ